MIRVENLTKQYGTQRGITDISFEVAKGEVVGFLGPNGAGKSTTMRILCGCIGATSGRAMVGGQDVLEHPREVKRRIGYLPEVPPLYGNMIVREYIEFCARIKGVADPAAATDKVIEQVALGPYAGRIVDHLSKGYRQRVGLAQALVHEPELLVLDEPTSGLDPAQRVEIRELLRKLAEGERTVILSTHVLGEIEALCKRVIIVNEGRLVAQDRIDALAAAAGATRLLVARPADGLLEALRAVPGVTGVDELGGGAFRVRGPQDAREHLAAAAVPFGLVELGAEERLEDIYLRLTTAAA